ncbi:MAG: hypothetical protein Q4A13_04040, partial [Fretibacterium sp.]|nr:hypothetical protein [Fretibacterium sp.]
MHSIITPNGNEFMGPGRTGDALLGPSGRFAGIAAASAGCTCEELGACAFLSRYPHRERKISIAAAFAGYTCEELGAC